MTNYWIGVASFEHVKVGVEQGFAQLGHGKASVLKSLKKGDWIVYYSPRTKLQNGEKVQAFTALGQISSESYYQAVTKNSFHPYRVDVEYQKQTKLADIQSLLNTLQLTRLRGSQWGLAFHRSKIRVSADDFKSIAVAMGADLQL